MKRCNRRRTLAILAKQFRRLNAEYIRLESEIQQLDKLIAIEDLCLVLTAISGRNS